ncbi:MAG: hypothetical protein NC405_00575 [Odoribacter sp.]|nr:hypothetical protein [Odoribacter sp.]
MIKRIAIVFILLSTALIPMYSQAQSSLSPDDRQRWLQEIRTYKHEFLTKELDLSRDQQNRFFPLYDEMEDRIESINAQTREIEDRVSGDATAGDIELTNAARALFELKKSEGDIELEYFDKFKDILQPRQLLMLKNAERSFTRQLVNRHRRLTNGRGMQ